jgi:hypothetical protein
VNSTQKLYFNWAIAIGLATYDAQKHNIVVRGYAVRHQMCICLLQPCMRAGDSDDEDAAPAARPAGAWGRK